MDGEQGERPWRIRTAAERDREGLEAVVMEAFSVYLPRMDRKPYPMLDDYGAYIRAGQAFVLEEDGGAHGEVAPQGSIRGCIVLVPDADGALSLEVLAVSGDAQGRGYGRALVDFALRRAKTLGCRRLKLYTNAVMTEAQAFYDRLGFTEMRRGQDAGYRRVFYEFEVGQG
ncbi:MAG: GNAT family N-acetyltransferase [Desulfovibrio sp.]|uniref:GNAT family N-acetyltransferase n=1 Tax=Desulfovibrio sp. TaxID=885 RepID=UPI001A66F802|nr:GNAT family N-acetyltransferase [Desulfovibrio sp.]MBD5417030.1 GNAT family N-acetyltransferase [Desulfovibrio sp.]